MPKRQEGQNTSQRSSRKSGGEQDTKEMKPQNFFDLVKRLEDDMGTNRLEDLGL